MNFIEVNTGNGHTMLLNLDKVEGITEGAKDATSRLAYSDGEYRVIAEPYEDLVARILEMQRKK